MIGGHNGTARAGGGLDVDEASLCYREQMLHALWMWTITLCHSPLLPATQPRDTARALLVRIATAMADLDSLSTAA